MLPVADLRNQGNKDPQSKEKRDATFFQEKYLKLPGPPRLKAQELNTVAQREIDTSFCSVLKNKIALFQLEWDV